MRYYILRRKSNFNRPRLIKLVHKPSHPVHKRGFRAGGGCRPLASLFIQIRRDGTMLTNNVAWQ